MPREHLDCCWMQTYKDVGGADFWLSSFYDDDHQWWVGFHTLKSFRHLHLSQAQDWHLIGYEKWPYHKEGWMVEAYYNVPNPSTAKQGTDLRPQGHWHLMYNRSGKRTCNTIKSNMI